MVDFIKDVYAEVLLEKIKLEELIESVHLSGNNIAEFVHRKNKIMNKATEQMYQCLGDMKLLKDDIVFEMNKINKESQITTNPTIQ